MQAFKIGLVAGLLLAALLVGARSHFAAAAQGDQHVGTWTGTWEGGGNPPRTQ